MPDILKSKELVQIAHPIWIKNFRRGFSCRSISFRKHFELFFKDFQNRD